MGWTADLAAGLGQLLDTKGLGVWRPDDVIADPETAIVAAIVPSAPTKVITLTLYGFDDAPTLSDTEGMVQVRTRGDRNPSTVDDLDDAVFDVLQNLPRTVVNGITISGCWRRSAAYLGVDGNGRHSRTSNYRLLTHRPSPHRI